MAIDLERAKEITVGISDPVIRAAMERCMVHAGNVEASGEPISQLCFDLGLITGYIWKLEVTTRGWAIEKQL